MIIGIDEVGRGSWAGPICVAAVAWPNDMPIELLDDSKKVSVAKRPRAALHVRTFASSIGIGWVGPELIDQIGVTAALKLAASRAMQQIRLTGFPVIIDGNIMLIEHPLAKTVIKADCSVPAVMAASIVAKVARDNYMVAMDKLFGGYGFAKHVGYGTAMHQAAIAQFGPCEQHRYSYAPLKGYSR
jgi:ribonuclease HII